MKKSFLTLSMIFILVAFTIIPSLTNMAQTTEASLELPVVGTYENFQTIIKEMQENNEWRMVDHVQLRGLDGVTEAQTNTSALKSTADISVTDYSSTNLQVQGVDEADTIKTDGQYLYQINYQQVVVSKIYPHDEMKVVKVIPYEENEFYPQELYVDNENLVVIGSYHTQKPNEFHQYVKAIIYDIEDKENIEQVRELELEGNYISSRKIGSSLYLVANKYMNMYYILEKNEDPSRPMYKDSNLSDDSQVIDYKDIHYFPNASEPNYLMVAGVNLDKPKQSLEIETYLGAGQNIYASTDNLYVTTTHYEKHEEVNEEINQKSSSEKKLIAPLIMNSNTDIYKFQLDEGNTTPIAKGSVPGTILNQFSMDENNGYFRIATTTGDFWRTDENTSKNNLYVLDSNLSIIGELEDIAPGERIYSVRFMGHRAYMVTFKKVDPLFVIDLSSPESPKILGKLKIPGYSDYLHPYDENHIIGFGKDTVELKNTYNDDTTAYYKGMKISLFDVSDVNNPKEKFVEIIGDRGTYSELLHNHKALLFSRDRNLLAFPVTVMEIDEHEKPSDRDFPIQYGTFTFQGAYIYQIDLEQGFKLRKKITHLLPEEYSKSGQKWYGNSNKNVERIIYINDILYTISQNLIKAHDIERLNTVSEIKLPVKENEKIYIDAIIRPN